jgi:hypothetical protein
MASLASYVLFVLTILLLFSQWPLFAYSQSANNTSPTNLYFFPILSAAISGVFAAFYKATKDKELKSIVS